MADATSHSSIWKELDTWAGTLKPWQKTVLGMIVKSRTLSDADVDVAYKLFCEETNLSEPPKSKAPTVAEVIGRPGDALKKQLRLDRIDGLTGVNAIPDGSTLTFGPNLTVIYGPNGAGKSGFARLIANGCFSRHKPEILGNIYEESGPPAASAVFHVTLDGHAKDPITVKHEAEHPDLLRISFFDVTVAHKHVSESTPFEFKPAGFDVFPEMARVFSEIGVKLAAEVKLRTREANFSASFIGAETDVSKVVAEISASSDIKTLEALGTYGKAEAARLETVKEQLVALKAKSPKELLASLKQAQADIEALSKKIPDFKPFCEPDGVTHLNELIKVAKDTSDAATALGSDQFKRSFFSAVGSAEWETFAKSAHALARQEGAAYPTAEDRCLLCERPYDATSRKHVDALLKFVEGDAQKASAEAGARLQQQQDDIEAVDVAIFAEASRVREHVKRINPAAETSLAEFSIAVNAQKEKAITASRERIPLTDSVALDIAEKIILALTVQIKEDIERLEKDDTEKAIATLELEQQTIRHREVLSQLLPDIRKFIIDAKWCALAAKAKAGLNPRAITDKEKDLFGKLIGGSYRKRLAEECGNLQCLMPIELQTEGQKGKTVRSLAIKGGHQPDEILSEGEQKAVALADFLTEVALNPANAGIALDDPVTSQDHERKQLIAARLVREAAVRQVIVFTHDLPFLNDIVLKAEHAGVDVQKHWIQRQEGKPGIIALDDAPTTSKSYDTTERAKLRLKEAKGLIGTPQQDAIVKGMEALRRTIEETVVKRLFKGAVPRWQDRVIVTKLTAINWDNALIDELVEMYEELSTYIEAHSHTDEAKGAPTEIKHLEERIARLDDLIKRARTERTKAPLVSTKIAP